VAYGQKDAGKIGDSPEMMGDANPNYTAGSPTATPPGATPPVGAEPMKKLAPQPGNQGSGDTPVQQPATDYSAIRDRIAGKRAAQTMKSNPGATFQSYGEETEVDEEEMIEEEEVIEEAHADEKQDKKLNPKTPDGVDVSEIMKIIKNVEKKKKTTECPPGKVRNPKTGRCINEKKAASK
jgi:hypothetical protein